MLIAVALFAVVMTVGVGALLALTTANRKAQALQSVMTNMSMAVDGMSRAVRMGSFYRCGSSNPGNPDCLGGGDSFYFESFGGDPSTQNDDWAYRYDATTKRIYKSEANGAAGSWYAITAPDVEIDDVTFYVTGANPGDDVQARVVMTIRGSAGVEDRRIETTFSVQSTATQRIIDI